MTLSTTLRVVIATLAALSLVVAPGCKRKKESDAPTLELTEEKTDEELRNLLALCKAAIDVQQMPGVQDRLGRIAEIAAPTSATTRLLDGLQAMEGPKRMGFVKALIEKYGTRKQCAGALPAFDRGPDRPGPEGPGAGQGQAGPEGQPAGEPDPGGQPQPGFPAGQPAQPGPEGEPDDGPEGEPGPDERGPGGKPPGGLRAP